MKYLALIVEDENSLATLMVNMLKIINIDAMAASTIKEAIDIINGTRRLDLLIVDWYLSDGQGSEIIECSKINKANVPIIMISGFADDIRLPSLVAGANVVMPKPFSEAEFLMIAKNLVSLSDAYNKLADAEQVISALVNTLEFRDSGTRGHSQNVANYSIKIYDALEDFTNNDYRLERSALYSGAILHDIGKIGIPDNILKSENTLTEEEFDNIKTHPAMGYKICKELDRLQPVLDVIYQHHERLDGSGYPEGLKGNKISKLAQIIMIPDMYDAMTAQRTYREPMSVKETLKTLFEEADNGRINKVYLEVFKSVILNIKE